MHYDECASFRVTEIAKVKGRRMIMERIKYEFAAILPGALAETSCDQNKVFVNEPRLAIAMNMWISKIKGNESE